MAKKKKKMLEITLTKSPIGYNKRQKGTVKALGLKKLNQTVTHEESDVINGMINKVSHLVTVVEK